MSQVSQASGSSQPKKHQADKYYRQKDKFGRESNLFPYDAYTWAQERKDQTDLERIIREKIYEEGEQARRKSRLVRDASSLIEETIGRVNAWRMGFARTCIKIMEILIGYTGGNNRVFPSYEWIAHKAGCHRSTVARCLKAVKNIGILSWVQIGMKVGERKIKKNLYRIHDEMITLGAMEVMPDIQKRDDEKRGELSRKRHFTPFFTREYEIKTQNEVEQLKESIVIDDEQQDKQCTNEEISDYIAEMQKNLQRGQSSQEKTESSLSSYSLKKDTPQEPPDPGKGTTRRLSFCL